MVVKYIYFHQLYISNVLSSDLILEEIKGYYPQGFPGGSMVKNPPANVGDAGDTGFIPGSGRSPRVENGNLLQYFAWEIPWTVELGCLQSMESQKARYD